MSSKLTELDTLTSHHGKILLDGSSVEVDVKQAESMFNAGIFRKAVVKREFDSWILLFIMSNSSLAILMDSRGSTRGFKLLSTVLGVAHRVGFKEVAVQDLDSL